MPSRAVLAGHEAHYADPIRVARGEPLTLTGREDDWDGYRWLWAVAEDGREGWVPDGLVREIDGRHIASRDYSAVELSCVIGETVDVEWETHGWAWCRNRNGEQGWVPLRNLSAG